MPTRTTTNDLAPAAQAAVERVNRLAYSPGELADALGVTRQHIQNLIARGELRSVKLGRRRLIPAGVVDEFLAGATAEAG